MSDLVKRMAAAADKLGLPSEDEENSRRPQNVQQVEPWTKSTDELLEMTDEYRRHESGYYFEDEEHFGTIFVSEEMVSKYQLEHTPIQEWYDEEYDSDDDEEQLEYLEEMKSKWAQVIEIDHCWGYSETSDRYHNGYQSKTPHGEISDEEFVAWWCDFPHELLKESKEHVYIAGWADG